MNNEPNYKHRWWTACFVAGWILVFAIIFLVQWQAAIGKPAYEALLEPLPAGNQENYVDGLREELVRCREDLEVALTPMDCTWEAWENRSISEEMDYRERAVAKCVQFTKKWYAVPEACEQYRFQSSQTLTESNLDLARLSLGFMLNAAGAGQCTYEDGSYWNDNGAWIREAIRSQEMLISWMESE